MILLQVFTPMHIALHIHVLMCVNVPIMLGHVTTQTNVTDSYIIDHVMVYVCIS